MNDSIHIDKIEETDWKQVKAIYLEGIATGNATFEEEAPSWIDWHESHPVNCRIKACLGSTMIGWAALSPVSKRNVYSGVGEVSVYVSQKYNGKGIGSLLLNNLVEVSEKNGFWTLQAGIFPEKRRSLRLHKKCGFREVGRREHIGKMGEVWRDTILLERRSRKIGNN